MASPNIYSSGLNLAGTVFANGPATLQLGGRVYLSGLVQWVDTIDGDNANAGNKPELPVATLAQAITNSASNGVIIIGAGSSETLSGSQTFGALTGVSVFGCGTGSSRPRYTCSGAVNMINAGNAGTWIEGLYFPASTAVATSRILVGADGTTIKDCYFECGANDTNRAVNVQGVSRIEGCSFVAVAERPAIGVEVSAATTDVTVVSCTFDGGSYGWTDYAFKVSAAATRVRSIDNTFTNQSDYGHTVTATSYQVYGLDIGGTANVLLTS
jgi:hypothetical protein